MISANSQIEGQQQGRLVTWIIHHQLALFFVSTLLVSWTIWGVLAQIPVENSATFSRIILIGGYAPSFSAILLSSIVTTEPRRVVSTLWWTVFFLALILAAGIEWLDHLWWRHQIDLSLVLADAILVFLAALTITRLITNCTQPHLRLAGVTYWRDWIWFLVALSFWPLLVLAGNAIARLFALPLPPNPAWPDLPLPFIILESLLWTLFFGGPLNEEPGWRGFALPRLQSRFSPLVASIILGATWGLWHVPQHLWGMYPGGVLGAVIRIQEIPRAIFFTWLYNRTRGSLLVMLLFHAAINTTSYFMARSYEVVFVLLFIVAVPFIISDKMWRRLPASGRTEKRREITQH